MEHQGLLVLEDLPGAQALLVLTVPQGPQALQGPSEPQVILVILEVPVSPASLVLQGSRDREVPAARPEILVRTVAQAQPDPLDRGVVTDNPVLPVNQDLLDSRVMLDHLVYLGQTDQPDQMEALDLLDPMVSQDQLEQKDP